MSASLKGSRVSHLFTCHQAELSIRSEMAANQTMGPMNLNKAVKMIKNKEIEASSSKVIHAQTNTIFLGSNMHVMMQTLEEGHGPCLPHGLSVMNTFTEMATRSKQFVVMVKNLTATLVTIAKGVKVTQVVAVNVVPQVEVASGTLGKLEKFRVSSRLGCQLSGVGRCSSTNWSYLAWRGDLTKTKQLPKSY